MNSKLCDYFVSDLVSVGLPSSAPVAVYRVGEKGKLHHYRFCQSRTSIVFVLVDELSEKSFCSKCSRKSEFTWDKFASIANKESFVFDGSVAPLFLLLKEATDLLAQGVHASNLFRVKELVELLSKDQLFPEVSHPVSLRLSACAREFSSSFVVDESLPLRVAVRSFQGLASVSDSRYASGSVEGSDFGAFRDTVADFFLYSYKRDVLQRKLFSAFEDGYGSGGLSGFDSSLAAMRLCVTKDGFFDPVLDSVFKDGFVPVLSGDSFESPAEWAKAEVSIIVDAYVVALCKFWVSLVEQRLACSGWSVLTGTDTPSEFSDLFPELLSSYRFCKQSSSFFGIVPRSVAVSIVERQKEVPYYRQRETFQCQDLTFDVSDAVWDIAGSLSSDVDSAEEVLDNLKLASAI